jgi:hypothetical protein
MLVLTRCSGQNLVIADNIVLSVLTARRFTTAELLKGRSRLQPIRVSKRQPKKKSRTQEPVSPNHRNLRAGQWNDNL